MSTPCIARTRDTYSLPLHCRYTAVTLLSHCCCTAVALLLHCCRIASLMTTRIQQRCTCTARNVYIGSDFGSEFSSDM